MYTPPDFTEPRARAVLDIVARNNFAALVHAADGDVSVTHAPVFLRDGVPEADDAAVEGTVVLLHLARANPVCRRIETTPRLTVVVLGPSHYVTPTWYETPGVVPTWNYAAVHLHCDVRTITDPDWLHAVFDRTSATHEPLVGGDWRRDAERQPMVDKLIRGVVGYELTVWRHEAIFKMSQNKSVADRRGVIAGLRGLGTDEASGVAEMAQAYLKEALRDAS